jgi:hypothetical protein
LRALQLECGPPSVGIGAGAIALVAQIGELLDRLHRRS